MKTRSKNIILLSCVFIGLLGLFWFSETQLSRQMLDVFSQNLRKEASVSERNPCGFRVDVANPVMNDMLREKQKRDENGYPAEISLADAVKLFNDELQCYPHRAIFPPLKEEEVIGAIIAGSDYGTEASWKLQSNILWEIASRRLMPKGSLLVHTDGARVIDYPLGTDYGFEVEAKGQRIYILLGLDKIPQKRGTVMKHEQFFLIRKHISGYVQINEH